MSDELEALAPEDAVKLYVQHREGEISSETLKSHGYRLQQFAEWCDDDGIHNLNNLTGRDLHRFRVHRQDNDGLKPVTLQGQLSTLRVFLNFCESIDAAEEGLHEKILLPHVSEADSRLSGSAGSYRTASRPSPPAISGSPRTTGSPTGSRRSVRRLAPASSPSLPSGPRFDWVIALTAPRRLLTASQGETASGIAGPEATRGAVTGPVATSCRHRSPLRSPRLGSPRDVPIFLYTPRRPRDVAGDSDPVPPALGPRTLYRPSSRYQFHRSI
ncbi:site-specific integrase [Halovenus rubra]|uniref:Site-specific integrase n=2 Tax=Halovenus rubra TaxID=869890 RepID=A0ACC7E1R5_9EURY